MKRTTILLIIIAAIAAACTPPPPAAVTPRVEDRYLVDPRTGYGQPAAPRVVEAFDAAWRYFLGGEYAQARLRLAEVRKRDPRYAPADLLEAAIAIREGKLQEARALVDAAPLFTASRIYRGEIAYQEHDTRRALELYREIARAPEAPATAAARVEELEQRQFDQLYHDALTAPDSEAVRLLREAIQIRPGATAPRILLARKLVAAKEFDEARRQLEPVLPTADVDRTDVQQILAEIDAGRGRIQEAIVRYDRLARREQDPSYKQRLNELKEQFAAANMPMQYQRALESESITRADFAVLLYWKVASVRFAQNVGTPPIAIDITELPGREELIRAIVLGIFSVDPVTRRVGPGSSINAGSLTRLAARVLSVRGASCARLPASDAVRILAACGITDPPSSAGPEAPVTGRAAAALLDQVDRALK